MTRKKKPTLRDLLLARESTKHLIQRAKDAIRKGHENDQQFKDALRDISRFLDTDRG